MGLVDELGSRWSTRSGLQLLQLLQGVDFGHWSGEGSGAGAGDGRDARGREDGRGERGGGTTTCECQGRSTGGAGALEVDCQLNVCSNFASATSAFTPAFCTHTQTHIAIFLSKRRN